MPELPDDISLAPLHCQKDDPMLVCRQWFAVRAKPNQECQACLQFANQGFVSYLPIALVKRRHARKVEVVRRPFFTGYLFLHLAPPERDWPKISSTRGALGAVHFGEIYPPVADDLIRSLREREDASGVVAISRPVFVKGQRVRVVMDDDTGMEGIFLDMRGEDRALLLVDFLKRQVRTTVPLIAVQTV